MATRARFEWQRGASPADLAANVRAYKDRLLEAILELARFFAGKIESYARRNARWTDRTTNARGVVSTMTLAELDELDAGSWMHPWADLDDEAVEVDQEFSRVLTLRRLCEVVRDYDRPVRLAVETKHPTRYAGHWRRWTRSRTSRRRPRGGSDLASRT